MIALDVKELVSNRNPARRFCWKFVPRVSVITCIISEFAVVLSAPEPAAARMVVQLTALAVAYVAPSHVVPPVPEAG